MSRCVLVLLLGFVYAQTQLLGQSSAEDWTKVIRTVAGQGPGTPQGRSAWDKLAAADASLLIPILEAMDATDTAAANWLRTAYDRIADREFAKSSKNIDAKALLGFAQDPTRVGRARRIALETVERLRLGVSATLYPTWLEDPEFRFEAVSVVLDEAKSLAKRGGKDRSISAFRRAFTSSRDLIQSRQAAAGLLAQGIQVSVAEHFGFLMDWYLIGPFDGAGMKGFSLHYPPEEKVDLAAELDGQNGKVRWKRYRIKEPPPTSAAKHQALLSLREKDALGDADDAVAYAYTAFVIDKAQQAEFRGAADDNFTVWVNGRKVFGFEERRNGVRLDRHRFRVPLQAGRNTVLVKICQTPAPNPEPNWEFFLRIADDTGKGIAFRNALP